MPQSDETYEEKADWSGIKIEIKPKFMEYTYTFNYFGFGDILGLIGGIGASLTGIFQGLAILFIMMYIFDLT